MADFLAEMQELGYSVEDEEWRSHHLFGLRMPESVDLTRLRDTLAEHGVSASLRGSALRLSANVYNDDEDVDVLRSVLRGAAA
jgi:selenocysteine lyase/cysteine desulfurase